MKQTDFKQYLYAGDTGFFVNFDNRSDDDAILLARQLGRHVMADQRFDGVVDVTPGFKNLLIHYNPLVTSFDTLTSSVDAILVGMTPDLDIDVRHWHVPVLYGGEAGPDLDDVAAKTGLHPDDVISAHIGSELTVAIMGFLPGLAYMKGVSPSLYLPRKSSPRAHVPVRSVGIAMDQTVIYPLVSPGGWNLIGRTPLRPFDASRNDAVLFNSGDTISFTSIDQNAFDEMDKADAHGEPIITSKGGAG